MTVDLNEVLTRGVAQILPSKDTLAELLKSKKIKLYLGIDPTGSLLHLGHSVVLRKLQQFAELGCETILLIGNGTVRIGDPSGRDSTRPVLTDAQIEENFQTWKRQASKILDFDLIKVKYNGDWLDKLDYAQIVKLLAKTTVQQLLERDMFQERVKKEQPIFGHEIIYPLLQGYDSVAMNVDLEIGGSDQTFNMLMGRHLQKEYNNREKWILSTPIINGLDGRKMSKSYNNYISLEENPNDMYGKLMSARDEVIIEYFTLLTDLPLAKCKEIETALANGENPMQYKKLLATMITAQYHDEKTAQKAAENFEKTVQKGELPDQIPVIKLDKQQLTWLELARICQPEKSGGDLKRLISQGGLEIIEPKNLAGKKTDYNEKIDSTNQSSFIIRLGKRNFYQIKI